MKTIYLDCASGISGDMFIGAMLGLGVDSKQLCAALYSLGLEDFEIKTGKTIKSGLDAIDFDVILKESGSHKQHRHLPDIEKIIDNAPLDSGVKSLAKRIFGIVAKAEGGVHGLPPEEVHFHEVGAADSIADIVGAAFCIASLGFPRIICSPIAEGSGHVSCEHGLFPVPAPATAEIFRSYTIPFYITQSMGEMATPTGAAIAAAVCESFGDMPVMTVDKIGCGAGKKEFEHPNVLRAFMGTVAAEAGDTVTVLETCIDDSTGEALGACLDKLMSAGMADAYFTPVVMKKGRPAYLLTVLCKKELAAAATRIIFECTGSIGLRVRESNRIVMQRKTENINTKYGTLPVKISSYGEIKKYKAEADAVVKAAAEFNVTADDVYREVLLNIIDSNSCCL